MSRRDSTNSSDSVRGRVVQRPLRAVLAVGVSRSERNGVLDLGVSRPERNGVLGPQSHRFSIDADLWLTIFTAVQASSNPCETIEHLRETSTAIAKICSDDELYDRLNSHFHWYGIFKTLEAVKWSQRFGDRADSAKRWFEYRCLAQRQNVLATHYDAAKQNTRTRDELISDLAAKSIETNSWAFPGLVFVQQLFSSDSPVAGSYTHYVKHLKGKKSLSLVNQYGHETTVRAEMIEDSLGKRYGVKIDREFIRLERLPLPEEE